MIKEIELIMNWNKIAWKNNFNLELEKRLLNEEVQETIQAMEQWDKKEILDWACDIIFVLQWMLSTLWFTPEQSSEALIRVIDNNYSKFQYDENWYHTCIRDKQGKILKPEWFTKVYLDDLIP